MQSPVSFGRTAMCAGLLRLGLNKSCARTMNHGRITSRRTTRRWCRDYPSQYRLSRSSPLLQGAQSALASLPRDVATTKAADCILVFFFLRNRHVNHARSRIITVHKVDQFAPNSVRYAQMLRTIPRGASMLLRNSRVFTVGTTVCCRAPEAAALTERNYKARVDLRPLGQEN
jgi:hypothetical protein